MTLTSRTAAGIVLAAGLFVGGVVMIAAGSATAEEAKPFDFKPLLPPVIPPLPPKSSLESGAVGGAQTPYTTAPLQNPTQSPTQSAPGVRFSIPR
jgi:hypothetical protein